MKPIESIYVHFLDRYHGLRAQHGNQHSVAAIRKEANLAFRLALMFSNKVTLPCSSLSESQLCWLTIKDFQEFNDGGVIGLSSPDGSIAEHLDRKKKSYDAASPSDLMKAYEHIRDGEMPVFRRKKGSTTRQISRAWQNMAEITSLEEFLRDDAPATALSQLERLWPEVPALLEGRAFVPDHVDKIFEERQIPIRASASAEVIEPAYIGDYTAQFGSVVSDLRTLNSPFEYGSSDQPRLSYRELVQRLHRFQLDIGFEYASSAALWDVYCSAEWNELAEKLLFGTCSSADLELARAVAGMLAASAAEMKAKRQNGFVLLGDAWTAPPRAANEPILTVHSASDQHGALPNMVEREPSTLFAAVICAVEREYKALIRTIPPQGAVAGNEYVTTLPGGRRVLVRRLASMGNYQSAASTAQLILEERPENLILAGIAGGFPSDDRRLGDLLIADQIIAYEAAKLNGSILELRPQAFRSSYALVEAAEAVLRDGAWRSRLTEQPPETRPDGPNHHIGTLLSGEKVVAKSGFMEDFRAVWTKTTGVEMEAAGAMTAVYLSDLQPRFVMVKAICDNADEEKADGWQPYAADVAAAFVAELLSSPVIGQPPKYVASESSVKLTNEDRYDIRERMLTSWQDVASFFDIPNRDLQQFRVGYQSDDLWEWLKSRRELHKLPAALIKVGRKDIVDAFPRLADMLFVEQGGTRG